jgi:hypothetical protein
MTQLAIHLSLSGKVQDARARDPSRCPARQGEDQASSSPMRTCRRYRFFVSQAGHGIRPDGCDSYRRAFPIACHKWIALRFDISRNIVRRHEDSRRHQRSRGARPRISSRHLSSVGGAGASRAAGRCYWRESGACPVVANLSSAIAAACGSHYPVASKPAADLQRGLRSDE